MGKGQLIMNNFVQLILGIWALSSIACFATKNDGPIAGAFFTTIVIGVGYFIYKLK